MARKKDWTKTMHGSQLLGPGDIIRVMDGGAPIQCRVLSCLASEDGSCFARIEILEGDRKGERISTKLTCDPKLRT
ncbi:MAG: hypothetical protein AB1473_20600 [Thermodesulfobacteriota bacterium]